MAAKMQLEGSPGSLRGEIYEIGSEFSLYELFFKKNPTEIASCYCTVQYNVRQLK